MCVEVGAKRRDLLCLTATVPWTDDRIRFDPGLYGTWGPGAMIDARPIVEYLMLCSSFPVFPPSSSSSLLDWTPFALLLLLIDFVSSFIFPFFHPPPSFAATAISFVSLSFFAVWKLGAANHVPKRDGCSYRRDTFFLSL